MRAITNKPKIGDGFSADTEVTAGSYNQFDPKATVEFDTGDTSAARLSVSDQNRDGTQYGVLSFSVQ